MSAVLDEEVEASEWVSAVRLLVGWVCDLSPYDDGHSPTSLCAS